MAVLIAGAKGCGQSVRMADVFWRLFEITGSITAYLMYKKLSE